MGPSERVPTEPAPDPDPVQAVEHADAPLELDTATACWPAVVDLVRGENAMLAALLSDARPIAIGERELTLAFPTGAAFFKRKAEQDDYRRATAEAVRSVTGATVALRYELAEFDSEGPVQQPSLVARNSYAASWRSSMLKKSSTTTDQEEA